MTKNTTTTPGANRTRALEIRVFITETERVCAMCDALLLPTDAVTAHGARVHCLRCSGMDDLEFLPAGDLSVTKLATGFAGLTISVFRRPLYAPRQRPQRIGILAPPEAIARAREVSEQNAEKRAPTLHVPRLALRGRDTNRPEPRTDQAA